MTEIAQEEESYESEDSESDSESKPTTYKWFGMMNDAGRAL